MTDPFSDSNFSFKTFCGKFCAAQQLEAIKIENLPKLVALGCLINCQDHRDGCLLGKGVYYKEGRLSKAMESFKLYYLRKII